MSSFFYIYNKLKKFSRFLFYRVKDFLKISLTALVIFLIALIIYYFFNKGVEIQS